MTDSGRSDIPIGEDLPERVKMPGDSTHGRSMEQVLTDARKIEEEFARQNLTAVVRADDLGFVLDEAMGDARLHEVGSEELARWARLQRALEEARQ